jgi:predicted dehydrogenase
MTANVRSARLQPSGAPVRWGILGAARIAVKHVIPAIQTSGHSRVEAIASRDAAAAERVASQFGIGRAYGSYEAIVADPNVDAVYIPLPNHLHVPWSLRAIEGGKHVLCEKPIGLTAAEARTLADAASRAPRLKVMEAFMYRFHPQWQRARELAAGGAIGEVRAIHTWFSYFNVDPVNVRNMKDIGGGALMDIGCYGISAARFITGWEPRRVSATSEVDPSFGTDRLTTAILDFGGAVGSFTCATQLGPHQRVDIGGTDGTIEIEIPFNPPIDRRCTIVLRRGDRVEPITLERANQFEREFSAFSCAVVADQPVPTPLVDAIANMQAIDAVKESARSNRWVEVRC